MCSCIGGRSPDAAAPAQILQNNIPESARFEQAAYKKEQEELLECENFETITELKSESLRWTDFAESEHWLRINERYIPKELAILGGAKVTFNIMNRDTTPVVFLYATGDVVKIDLEFRSVPGKSGNLMHTSGPAVAFLRNRQTGQRRENCGRSVLRKCRHI